MEHTENSQTRESLTLARTLGWFWFAACLVLAATPQALFGSAAAPQLEDLTAALEALRTERGPPALAGVITFADGRTEIAVTGRRRIDAAVPALSGDRWHIGSNTKAMTAALAARLVESGRIRWETTLSDAFPELRPGMDPAWRSVTLEQLLRMVGGAPADVRALDVWRAFWRDRKPLVELRLDLVREVVARAPQFPPGTAFLYSNASYVMAGAMLERATRRAWEDLLRAEVFEPLGMTETGFGAPQGDQPWGHRKLPVIGALLGLLPTDPEGARADNPPALGPAGTVHVTLADYARWLRAVIDGANGRGTFLHAQSWERLLKPGLGDYAMGWGVRETPWAGSGPGLGHAGSNTLWLFHARVAPSRGFAVAVAANAADSGTRAAVPRALDLLIARASARP